MSAATASLSQRVRVNVTRTATRGYTSETTAEVEWNGDLDAGLERLAVLLMRAELIARAEVANREANDRTAEHPIGGD